MGSQSCVENFQHNLLSFLDKPCFKKRREIEENKKSSGNTVADLIPPSCDPLGYFTHVQCRPGGPCFCVDKLSGKPLSKKRYYVPWLPENICAGRCLHCLYVVVCRQQKISIYIPFISMYILLK